MESSREGLAERPHEHGGVSDHLRSLEEAVSHLVQAREVKRPRFWEVMQNLRSGRVGEALKTLYRVIFGIRNTDNGLGFEIKDLNHIPQERLQQLLTQLESADQTGLSVPDRVRRSYLEWELKKKLRYPEWRRQNAGSESSERKLQLMYLGSQLREGDIILTSQEGDTETPGHAWFERVIRFTQWRRRGGRDGFHGVHAMLYLGNGMAQHIRAAENVQRFPITELEPKYSTLSIMRHPNAEVGKKLAQSGERLGQENLTFDRIQLLRKYFGTEKPVSADDKLCDCVEMVGISGQSVPELREDFKKLVTAQDIAALRSMRMVLSLELNPERQTQTQQYAATPASRVQPTSELKPEPALAA